MKKLTQEQKIERNNLFIRIVSWYQKSKNADWIKAEHVRKKFFGDAKDEKELRTQRVRIYRLGETLEKKGLVKTTKRMERVGDSSGLSPVLYFHVESNTRISSRKK